MDTKTLDFFFEISKFIYKSTWHFLFCFCFYLYFLVSFLLYVIFVNRGIKIFDKTKHVSIEIRVRNLQKNADRKNEQ